MNLFAESEGICLDRDEPPRSNECFLEYVGQELRPLREQVNVASSMLNLTSGLKKMKRVLKSADVAAIVWKVGCIFALFSLIIASK